MDQSLQLLSRAQIEQEAEAKRGAAGESALLQRQAATMPFVDHIMVLDANGKLLRTQQVLNEANFASIVPGTRMEEVRKMLGKPAKQIPYELQNEIHWQYKYLAPNNVDEMLFTVVFVPSTMAVKSASGGPDPQGRGGVLRN